MTHLAADKCGIDKCRVDKWLWQARFFKSRSLAARLVNDGKLRINDVRATKASVLLKPGDVLTFPQRESIRVVRVVALGLRRGPASEAAGLYDDLSPAAARAPEIAPRDRGSGRPTKAERRATEKLRGGLG